MCNEDQYSFKYETDRVHTKCIASSGKIGFTPLLFYLMVDIIYISDTDMDRQGYICTFCGLALSENNRREVSIHICQLCHFLLKTNIQHYCQRCNFIVYLHFSLHVNILQVIYFICFSKIYSLYKILQQCTAALCFRILKDAMNINMSVLSGSQLKQVFK